MSLQNQSAAALIAACSSFGAVPSPQDFAPRETLHHTLERSVSAGGPAQSLEDARLVPPHTSEATCRRKQPFGRSLLRFRRIDGRIGIVEVGERCPLPIVEADD